MRRSCCLPLLVLLTCCLLLSSCSLAHTGHSMTATEDEESILYSHKAEAEVAAAHTTGAQRNPQARHSSGSRTLSQQLTASQAVEVGLEAAADEGFQPPGARATAAPVDAASAVAAALSQPLGGFHPRVSAGGAARASVVGIASVVGGGGAAADRQPGEQQQLPQQQQLRIQRQQESATATDQAYDPFGWGAPATEPAASSSAAAGDSTTQEQTEEEQQQQTTTSDAASATDEVDPPNDNSELLPPPTDTTPEAPPPTDDSNQQQPPPAPTDQPLPPPSDQPPQPPPAPEEGLEGPRPWLNPELPMSVRISSLLNALTLEEKIPMMIHGQAGVPRLGLKPFQFWTECLHGHQERYDGAALPTIFPQPLMLAATFDPALAQEVFGAISDELRAKSNVELDKTGIHKFLTCWTPHINIFKDPRWGRGSETFGEDPFLTAAFAQNIVKGLQGDSHSITKVVATCKHFLGYGLEGAEGVSRYSHNLELGPQDMTDTDLPPFQACVQAAAGKGIMCSYNAVNGEPACASKTLLQDLLRRDLGFSGYVVSDCNAVAALTWGHGSAGSYAEAAAASLKAGVDMFCDRPDLVKEAVAAGTLTEADLDQALTKTLLMRFITGQFDPRPTNPWASLAVELTVNSWEHRKLARQVVHKGTVLLQNSLVSGTNTPLLPLDRAALKKVCITGPLADSPEHLMGNYYGKWDDEAALTPKRAIKEELAKAGVNVSYSRGMDIIGEIHYDWPLESTLEACAGADVGLVFVGSSMVELKKGSDGAFTPATEGEGLDRLSLDLPGRQADLIKALARRAPSLPLVVVLVHGGGLDVGWMQRVPQVKSIISVPFPGQEGGRALVNLLFGNQSPSGRLPITWYRNSYTAAAAPLNLNMRPDVATGHPGRSYRFVKDRAFVLYPFGYGLSYTTFSYSGLRVLYPGDPAGGCLNPGAAPAMCITLTVTNTGGTGFKKPAEHVVPLYLSHTTLAGVDGHPVQSLRGVARTQPLTPGQSQQLTFSLNSNDFKLARAADGASMLAPGVWRVAIGVWDAPLVSEVLAEGGGVSTDNDRNNSDSGRAQETVVAAGSSSQAAGGGYSSLQQPQPLAAAPATAAAAGGGRGTVLEGDGAAAAAQEPPGVVAGPVMGPAIDLDSSSPVQTSGDAAAVAGSERTHVVQPRAAGSRQAPQVGAAAATAQPGAEVTYSGGPVAVGGDAGPGIQQLEAGLAHATTTAREAAASAAAVRHLVEAAPLPRTGGGGSGGRSVLAQTAAASDVVVDSQRGLAVTVEVAADVAAGGGGMPQPA